MRSILASHTGQVARVQSRCAKTRACSSRSWTIARQLQPLNHSNINPWQAICASPCHLKRQLLVATRAGIDLNTLGIDIPEIDAADIASYQEELGAEFNENGVALTFSNTDRVLEALSDGVAVLDRSHWGRLRIAGKDRLDLLHNQSTADFKALRPGQGCDTVFVTATARCLDLATAIVLDSSVMLITSPNMKQQLLQRLDKYIFPADDVSITDVSDKCKMLTLLGPQADDVMQQLTGDAFVLEDEPYCRHQLLKFAGNAPIIVAVGTGLAVPGYTLIVDARAAPDVYAALVNKGCVPMGEADWERARITQGRPAAGTELTPDHNPLEAGLCHAVSLEKGCYIGQETLAKVTNTNGIKQQLWGLQLSCRALPGATITTSAAEGAEVIGRLTSYVNLEQNGHFGLGYLRSRKRGVQVPLEGITVEVDGQPAKVVNVPYVTRQLPKQQTSSSSSSSASIPSSSPTAANADVGIQDRAAAANLLLCLLLALLSLS
eukprot:GHRR01012885.1.p1 GENE.GHRR01012885.1~~GHRR01012885.1.p1  ORF type:complete len:492 (+),score=176.68 GHRR01012885.1:215-1690(+)